MDLAEAVRHAFEYQDGELIWRNPPKNHAGLKGKSAGLVDYKGYTKIQFMGKAYRRHRLVWLYHNGALPYPVCDHIDRDRGNDRIENLRILTMAQNTRNHKKISVRVVASGRFQARLAQRVIGTFDTFAEAKRAYLIERNREWVI